jgi:hypothetical protein
VEESNLMNKRETSSENKKLYKANQALRRKDIKEWGLWHRDLIPAWRSEIEEKDDKLIVPRAAFRVMKNLK